MISCEFIEYERPSPAPTHLIVLHVPRTCAMGYLKFNGNIYAPNNDFCILAPKLELSAFLNRTAKEYRENRIDIRLSEQQVSELQRLAQANGKLIEENKAAVTALESILSTVIFSRPDDRPGVQLYTS